jgi:putative sigma-54 modulation protein
MANVNVQTRNCEIKEFERSHIEEKLGSLERLWPKSDEAIVRIVLERGRYSAEVTLVSAGIVTRGEERADNVRQAFDEAVEKIERQLNRYKTKMLSLKRRHDNRDDVAGTVLNRSEQINGDGLNDLLAAPNHGAEVAGENGIDDHVVRVKRFALKPMAPEEAAMQMDLLGHGFFVFRDAGSNEVSVVYRRRSGGYGLIEPVAD